MKISYAICTCTEYQELDSRLGLLAAVVVQPLTRAQVDSYLASAGAPSAGMQEALHLDETLYDLLDTPLTLSVTILACGDEPAGGLQIGKGIEEQRARMFAAYVDAMHARRGSEVGYTRAQSERWLA